MFLFSLDKNDDCTLFVIKLKKAKINEELKNKCRIFRKSL